MFLPALAGDDAAADADGSEAAQAASLPRGLRVLLVEDDLEVRRVAQAFLESMACEVVACTSGEAALTALDGAAEGRGFDLLFSDIMLGAGIDGRELAQRTGATHPALTVLLTSGYSSHLAQSSKADAPMRWPVLKKPYTRRDLAQAIAQCLSAKAG